MLLAPPPSSGTLRLAKVLTLRAEVSFSTSRNARFPASSLIVGGRASSRHCPCELRAPDR
jgi:hypothetical protein